MRLFVLIVVLLIGSGIAVPVVGQVTQPPDCEQTIAQLQQYAIILAQNRQNLEVQAAGLLARIQVLEVENADLMKRVQAEAIAE